MATLNEALESLSREIQASQLVSTEDIIATRQADGTRVRLRPKVQPPEGGSGSSEIWAYYCIVTAGTPGDGYSVDVYDSLGGSKLGTAIVYVPLLMFGETLPVGSAIVSSVVGMSVIGDGDGVGG